MKKFFINTIYINLFLTLLLTGVICKILFYNCTCCNNYKENMSNILSKSTPIYNNLTKTLLGSSNFSNNNYFLQTDNDIYNNLYFDQLNNQELTKQNFDQGSRRSSFWGPWYYKLVLRRPELSSKQMRQYRRHGN